MTNRPDLRLFAETWLEDEHMNVWLQQIIRQVCASNDEVSTDEGKEEETQEQKDKGGGTGRSDVVMINSLTMEVLEKHRNDNSLDIIVEKRHDELRLDQADRLLIPVSAGGNHWILFVVLLTRHVICIYDSMRECTEPRTLSLAAHRKADAVRQFLYTYGEINKVKDFCMHPWVTVACGFSTPQNAQGRGGNCGIYCLLVASLYCNKREYKLVDTVGVKDVASVRRALITETKYANRNPLHVIDWLPIITAAGLSCTYWGVKPVQQTMADLNWDNTYIGDTVSAPLLVPVCRNPILHTGRPPRLCTSKEKSEAIHRAMRYKRLPYNVTVKISHATEGQDTTLGDCFRFDFPFTCADLLYSDIEKHLIIHHLSFPSSSPSLSNGKVPHPKSTAPLVIVLNGNDDTMLTAYYAAERLLETFYESCEFVMVGNTFSEALSVFEGEQASLSTSSAMDESLFFDTVYPKTKLPRSVSDAVNEISCIDSVVALASRFKQTNFRLWRAHDNKQLLTIISRLEVSVEVAQGNTFDKSLLPCVVFIHEPCMDCNWLALSHDVHVYNIVVMWNYGRQTLQQSPLLGKRKRSEEDGESSGAEQSIVLPVSPATTTEPSLYCKLFYFFHA